MKSILTFSAIMSSKVYFYSFFYISLGVYRDPTIKLDFTLHIVHVTSQGMNATIQPQDAFY